MNSIKLGIFDIFAYALPGSVFLFTIFMLWGDPVQNITNIHVLFKDMKFSQIVLYVVLSYLIGFSLDSIGSIFFYKVIFKLFKNNPRKKNKEKYSLNKDQVLEILMLIREKSPKNNEMLQTWKVLKTMSHNISFILFIFSLLLILKIVFYKVTSVLILLAIIIFCIVNSAILMHRAWIFEDWYYNDLIATAKAFQFGNLKLNKER